MARVTHVKSAKPRYKTVPVIDPKTGVAKRQTFTRKDGSLRKNKRGEVVTAAITREDRTQPLPNRKCGRCGKEIEPGMGYYWWANKRPGSGSGYKQIRCEEHPPTLAERTPGRAGQLMQIQSDLERSIGACEGYDDLTNAQQEAADAIREFGAEFTEGADNMESGFGHETYQSQELHEKGEALESLADDIESLDIEEFDEDAVRAELAEDNDEADEDEIEELLNEKRNEWLDEQRDKIIDTLNEAEV